MTNKVLRNQTDSLLSRIKFLSFVARAPSDRYNIFQKISDSFDLHILIIIIIKNDINDATELFIGEQNSFLSFGLLLLLKKI